MDDAPAPAPHDAASHPPLAPGRTLKTSRPSKEGELLDDGGRPVILADMPTLRASMYENKPPFPWKRALAWTLVAVVATYLLLVMFNLAPLRSPFGCMWVFAWLIPTLAWRRGGQAATPKKDLASCAMLVRAGRCGGCGFSLRELVVDSDGCVACSECGAAWHRDRWRVAAPDAEISARKRIDGPSQQPLQPGNADDRGLPVANSLLWEPKWFSEAFDAFIRDTISPQRWAAASKFHAQAKASSHRQQLRYGLYCFGGAAVLVLIFALIGFDKVSADGYVVGILVLLIGFICAAVLSQSKVDTRGTALKHGLCPACGELLDLSQPRQFDGCIQCGKCAAAWKVDATPRETPTDSGRTTGTSQPALQPAAPESPKEPARG